MYLVICNTYKTESLAGKDAYPWVQFGWHGRHSRSWSAYLKMKLFAPCKPSGHFSTQFGPSLKWKHLVQLSGPWSVKTKQNGEGNMVAIFSGMYSHCLVPKTSVGSQSPSRELGSICRSTYEDVAIVAFNQQNRRMTIFSFRLLFRMIVQWNNIG